MIRVIVVDDHQVIRDSLADLLAKSPRFKLVASIPDADHAEALCARLHPDLVILDVCTDGAVSGLTVAERLRAAHPKLRIIVMSGFDEITYNQRAREAGANAFVPKSKGMDEFERIIDDVLAGQDVFLDRSELPEPDIIADLTDRELQVLRLLCEHRSRREIAATLYLSEMTVKRHVASILMKTGFADSVALAFHMISHGWINPRF